MCLPMFFLGIWCLLFPCSYRDAIVRMSTRISDKDRIDPFIRFAQGKYFIFLLRLFGLFAIFMGAELLRAIR